MRKVRLLLAEDTKVNREEIIEKLRDYELEKFGSNDVLEITKAESYVKADLILEESRLNGSPFEVFFCDIDFTEDQKGGKRDSGFSLIRKAFEISGLTNIYTYSGQFKAADLWDGYEELLSKGLVIKTFDKSDSKGGSIEWVNDFLDKLFSKLDNEWMLWDIWANHNIFRDAVMNTKFSPDPFENLLAQSEITSNLDTILYLLKNSGDFDAIKVIYRLVIQLYHRCLESFCRGGKSYEVINSDYDKNRAIFEERLNLRKENNDNKKGEAIKAIIAYSTDRYTVSGYKVNFFRNKSVHPGDNFDVGLCNVLYCSIALALYATKGKWDIIKTDEIEKVVKTSTGKAAKDLLDLLSLRP